MANKVMQRRRREQMIEENGVIYLNNVSKSYSTGSPALNGISLSIGRGEFVFIVGDSGSGKSTLIKLLLRDMTWAGCATGRFRNFAGIWVWCFRISVC